MLLSEARTRVAALCDDDGTRFSESEIDDALLTAQKEVWQLAVNSGSRIFEQQTTITTNSSGVGDLTGIKPIKIVSISEFLSGVRYLVNPQRHDQAPANATISTTLAIVYIPRTTFPANASTAFTWGHANITDTSLFDKLMCVIAVSDLKIKDAEVNPALESRKAELRTALVESISIPGFSVIPMDQFTAERDLSSYEYVMTAPDTLQLVLA